MGSKFFEELSRCLGKEQIESLSKEDRRLEIFLHGQPVLSVSPGNEVFMLPSGSKNPEANELYHRVAIAADRVFEYVEAMENTPLLRARGLDNKFHLLADFGGAVLAGRERGTGRGYEFVTYAWFVMTDCNIPGEQIYRDLTLEEAIRTYLDSDRPEKRLGVTKDGIATVDLVRSLNGEQHFFTDHLQLDSFKRDPEIAAAVKTLRLELEQNTPQQGITIGGLS